PGQWHKDFRIGLGLDLSSGTQVTMLATTPNGATPSSAEMNEAIAIITSRVNGTGNSGATVQTQGNDIITVSVPGKTTQQTVALVSTTALLRFRQVLLYQAYQGTTTTPSASASPSGSASPSASAGSTAKATPSASATSTAKTSAKIVADARASATPSATPSAKPTASASASASPSPSPSPSTASTVYGDSSKVKPDVLALFNKLTCKPGESDTVWKAQVGYTQSSDWDNPDAQIVSCDSNGGKYALDVAKVLGEDVTNATAELSTTSNQWEVILTFNSAGTSAFGALTTSQYDNYYASGQSGNEDDVILDEIAIVLDGNVVSAPETTTSIPGGNALITGDFTQAEATQLQNVLKYGSLPLKLTPQSVQSVSPTLGRNQLDAGLLAAAIGLTLVIIYSFIYYRGLGLVSVSSLMVSALLTTLSVILLTKYQNFTLSLAGVAGLIVAIGITADSFVVFFERLRDEVREGKQLRPAVEAGWKRARRTILVSDTVSFLAALLLYYFAISDVKGFAYTLGLTTIIDVVVVFLFTHPMLTLVSRTKFYGGGHPLSGLDPDRLGARAPWRSSVRRTDVRARSGASTSSRSTGEA
ncbi:MAG TPA: protein translocase subunit SecD, partial [Streptosporangiaceae bacterium]|nr:protein translocase subunit SecD [Streptosporangiaceae bacterium]